MAVSYAALLLGRFHKAESPYMMRGAALTYQDLDSSAGCCMNNALLAHRCQHGLHTWNLDTSSESLAAMRWLPAEPLESLGVSPPDFASRPLALRPLLLVEGLPGS